MFTTLDNLQVMNRLSLKNINSPVGSHFLDLRVMIVKDICHVCLDIVKYDWKPLDFSGPSFWFTPIAMLNLMDTWLRSYTLEDLTN